MQNSRKKKWKGRELKLVCGQSSMTIALLGCCPRNTILESDIPGYHLSQTNRSGSQDRRCIAPGATCKLVCPSGCSTSQMNTEEAACCKQY